MRQSCDLCNQCCECLTGGLSPLLLWRRRLRLTLRRVKSVGHHCENQESWLWRELITMSQLRLQPRLALRGARQLQRICWLT